MELVYSMFELPIYIRAMIWLTIVLLLWRIFAKQIVWILSIVPFLLRKVFILIYMIIKTPITLLHKLCGGDFYLIDNMWSDIGEKIDDKISKWYKKWHSSYTYNFKNSILCILLCYVCIIVPTYISQEISAFNVVKDIYCAAEDFMKQKFEEADVNLEFEDSLFGKTENSSDVELIVYNVNTTLYVRDIPDKNEGQAIDKLYNGDRVVWTGKLTFVEWEDGNIEVLIKVITENGIEGWSLFDYFYPSEEIKDEIIVGID